MVTLGLKTLFPGQNPSIDIVAVHGLGANPDWAWVRKTDRPDADGRRIHVNWLGDLDMLPSRLPYSRIMTFNYESQWILGNLKQRQSLCAIQLLTALDNQRNEEPDTKGRPIVFIGHSFGGIVVEEATRQACTKSQFGHVLASTQGVLFLGTPHRGSGAQKWGQIIATSARALGFHTDDSIMKSLSVDSKPLIDLVDDFVTLAKEHSIEIVCFFEQHKTDYAKGAVWGSGMLAQIVVDEASACIPGYQKVSLATDHFKINKYTGPNDEVYRVVYPILKRIVRDSLYSLDAQRTAEFLVNQNRVEEQQRKAQPLAQLGIDLKRLETEYLRNVEEMDDVRYGIRYYIPTEGTERFESQERFDLANRVRFFLDDDMGQKVFLILGPAGSGKSTFNHYLARQLWKRYDALPKNATIPLFISLASLKLQMGGSDLIGMYLKEHHFSAEQIRLLQCTRKFVFILDGYDEIRYRDGNFYQQNMLDKWDAKVVLSSRPEYLGSGYESKFHPPQKPRLFQQCWLAPVSHQATMDYIQKFVRANPTCWSVAQYTELINRSEASSLISNPFLLVITMSIAPKLPPGNFSRAALYDGFIMDWLDRSQKRLNNIQLTESEIQAFEYLYQENYTKRCLEYCHQFALALYRHQVVEVTYSSSPGKNSHSDWDPLFLDTAKARIMRFNAPLFQQENRYRFIHKSIRDFLVSRAILDELKIKNVGAGVLLNEFDLVKDLDVLNFIVECVKSEPAHRLRLLQYLELSKRQIEVQTAAANAITILVRAGRQFSGSDLRGIKIAGADLSFGVFDHTNFAGANLTSVSLRGAWLAGANCSQASMSGVQFGESSYMIDKLSPSCCCFSPDGKMIAVAYLNTVGLWSVIGQQLVKKSTSKGFANLVGSVVYSSDGKTLASGSYDKTVRLWSVEERRLEHTLEGHTDGVSCVAFSPDCKTVTSASYDNTVRLWSIEDQQLVHTFEGHTDRVNSVAYSPDGRRLASGSRDKTVRLWSIEHRQLVHTFQGQIGSVLCVLFSQDGETLASCDYKNIRLWSVQDLRLIHTFKGHTDPIYHIAYSPDGKTLASASRDKTVRLWSVEDRRSAQTTDGHTDRVNSVVYSADSKTIASAGIDNTIRLWSVQDRRLLQTLRGHTASVSCVVFSPEGKILASASKDKTVRLWSVEDARLVHTFQGHTNFVYNVVYSPDGKTLASASRDGTVRLWAVEDRRLLHTVEGHTSCFESVAYSPDGKTLATAGNDNTVWLWSVEDRQLVHRLQGHIAGINSVTYSPDGKNLASAGEEGTVWLWSVGDRRVVHKLHGHISVVYSPNGKTLASASRDGTVWLWSVEDGLLVYTLKGHTDMVNSVVYSPDGKILASGSYDKSVRLWSIEDGRLVQILQGHTEGVSTVVFSPDGKTLVSIGQALCLWSITPGQYLSKHDGFSIPSGNDPSPSQTTLSVRSTGFLRVARSRSLSSLIWKSGQTELAVTHMRIDGARGVSDTVKRLLMQRGAATSSFTARQWDMMPPNLLRGTQIVGAPALE